MDSVTTRKVYRHSDGSVQCVEDSVAVEKKVRVSVNGKEVLRLYCTPLMVKELVVGLVMTENIIRGNWCVDRMSIEYGDDILVDIPAEGEVLTGGMTITSGCVGGVTFENKMGVDAVKDEFTIDSNSLKKIFSDFQARSELYKLTGCVHSVALSDGKVIICFAEDIGRHNAVDKVVGYALLENIPFSGKIMLASGRISSEIASKCSRWGIPILATRAAPTNLAVEIAEKSGVTIVGFVRGNRFNVYTHPERIS
ncbi:MAG TPA: formate dehydrogenase accessory sulfurtransferase FdhD [Thermodesulfovibrionales bacterium]|nr:formate dehydrogenase accessory sulfurtransferase FdhD [Thermodesulfovibrionales bacterium]